MLWGKYAQSKKLLIDTDKHYVLEAPHPSPFSAYTGFFGCKHFSQCNEYLEKHGHQKIVW
jgi:uracil-DNA glycosylase